MKLLSLLVFLLLCSVGYAQIVYDTIPINRQLIGRDIITNTGDVIINGNVDNMGVTYDAMEVALYRDNVLINTFSQNLNFTGNFAPFDFKIPITAELFNYKVEIFGKTGITATLEETVDSLVAGDVYIINGQSNAEAKSYDGSANANQDDFIRVYANGTNIGADLASNDKWYIGQGDGDHVTNGNTGQWGLKLAKMLVDSLNIPIAIFNGAEPGKELLHFFAYSGYQTSLVENYGRLYHRLNKTGLKEKVKAVFWSQGENDALLQSTRDNYKPNFLIFYNDMLFDYPNIEKFYIFQSANGCFTPSTSPMHSIKEAQRQVAFEDPNNISIMSTAAGLKNVDDCHFVYSGGYELFAERVFELAYRDIYNNPITDDIDAPMIIGATLTTPTTLEIETDALSSLIINSTADDFLLEDASQINITNTITSFTTSGNKIIVTLSANPGPNATFSYLGPPGDTPGNFIVNQEGIEILCFYRYPITEVGPLLITQYYEGDTNDQWIEVKNISSSPVNGGDFHLALFNEAKAIDGTIETSTPDQSEPIVSSAGSGNPIAPGEVILFKNTTAPSLPAGGNLGSAHTISTDVCTFTGDDVIIISSANNSNSYDDRIDIIGEVAPIGQSPSNWGQNTSFIKGCDNTELPSKVFNVNDYTQLLLDDVNNADGATNIALGTQYVGATTWTTSWDNGPSDKTRKATVSGSYTEVDGSLSACHLLVSGTLNFDNITTNYVEVIKDLSITGVFELGDNATLYTVDSLNLDVPITISGLMTKNEITTILADNNDYTYWSSPVENQNISNVFTSPLYNQGRIYYWDQSVANTVPGGGSEAFGEWIAASNEIMIPGKGYISQGPVGASYPSETEVSFLGKPNNGTIKLIGTNDVVYNDNINIFDDLNLVGNPYPSAIDAHKFIENNTNQNSITGTIWFWTHHTPNNMNPTGEQYTSDDYASYNLAGSIGTGIPALGSLASPTRFIGSGQGFMVRTISATNDTIVFTDAMRYKDKNTEFFRGSDTKNLTLEEDSRIWLNLESSEGGAFSQILIGFFDNATDGVDNGYDGIKISQGWVNLYSKIDTLNYGIQGLGNFNIEKKIPLAFNSYISDTSVTYSLSIDHFEGELRDNDIYLVDNELNITHDLNQGAYAFSIPSHGSYSDRFTLQFAKTTLDVDDLSLQDNFTVSNEEGAIFVKSNKIINQIKVYDITGRLLIVKKPEESNFRINSNSIRKGSVLILNATFENGSQITKKAIKY